MSVLTDYRETETLGVHVHREEEIVWNVLRGKGSGRVKKCLSSLLHNGGSLYLH